MSLFGAALTLVCQFAHSQQEQQAAHHSEAFQSLPHDENESLVESLETTGRWSKRISPCSGQGPVTAHTLCWDHNSSPPLWNASSNHGLKLCDDLWTIPGHTLHPPVTCDHCSSSSVHELQRSEFPVAHMEETGALEAKLHRRDENTERWWSIRRLCGSAPSCCWILVYIWNKYDSAKTALVFRARVITAVISHNIPGNKTQINPHEVQ